MAEGRMGVRPLHSRLALKRGAAPTPALPHFVGEGARLMRFFSSGDGFRGGPAIRAIPRDGMIAT